VSLTEKHLGLQKRWRAGDVILTTTCEHAQTTSYERIRSSEVAMACTEDENMEIQVLEIQKIPRNYPPYPLGLRILKILNAQAATPLRPDSLGVDE
jgi:hypothetical protein